MRLNELKPAKGSTKRKKRLGRGCGSGLGKTSGKGHKGQKSRSGSKSMVGFEGGQMPLIRKLPKRGFNNKFKVIYQIVNVERLSAFKDSEVVDIKKLKEANMISTLAHKVKILGNGELLKPLTVCAHKFTQSASDKIEKAKGTAKVIT